jgi:hypothetical protein
MDLLLRRHARRRGAFASGAGEPGASGAGVTSAGTHLDADEMNAYAEGVVPEAVRARYVAHLADCDQCRAIVTQLTLAANPPIKDEERAPQQATTPQGSWREWLAALFAPPMIRYGATALALLCVAGILFLAMRQQRSSSQQDGPTYVAQNKESTAQPGSAAQSNTAQPSVAQASPPAAGVETNPTEKKDSALAKEARPPSDTETGVLDGQQSRPQPSVVTREETPAAAAAPSAPAPLSSAESAPKPAANEPRRNEVPADRDSPAASRPAPTTTVSPGVAGGTAQETVEVDRVRENRKDGPVRDERGAGAGATNNTASARESEDTVRLSRRARASEARQKSADRVQAKSEGADTSTSTAGRAGARSTETRSVGGRQFRREGSAWVDTAYNAGRATVNIKRGSEQYRALVADEPGIRTIADQLGGEVIVVWKARAYRIR